MVWSQSPEAQAVQALDITVTCDMTCRNVAIIPSTQNRMASSRPSLTAGEVGHNVERRLSDQSRVHSGHYKHRVSQLSLSQLSQQNLLRCSNRLGGEASHSEFTSHYTIISGHMT